MEETFEIENKKDPKFGSFNMLYCRKRKLEVIATERFDIPPHDDKVLLVFGILKKTTHPKIKMPNDVVICFGICEHELIDYEPYFRNMLIHNAINYYAGQEWGTEFDQIRYSPGYHAEFIDTMSLDPAKMNPELIGYMSRDISEEPLDFFEWKEKHLQPFLN